MHTQLAGDEAGALEFALSPKDYAAFARFAATQSRLQRRRIIVVRLLCFAVLALSVAWGFFAGDVPRLYRGLPMLPVILALAAVAGAFGVLLSMVLFPAYNALFMRLSLRDKSYAPFFEPMRLEVSPEGLNWTRRTGAALLRWPAVVEIEKGRRGLYIYVTSRHAHIVPRHAFADDAAFERFAAKLADYRRRFRGERS